MNRLTIGLLLALILSVVTGAMVALFQQQTITTLRRENARLTHAQGTGEAIPIASIPGRYRWIKDGVDSGIISLNADHTLVGATGSYGDQQYRWFYQGGQLMVVWATPTCASRNPPGRASSQANTMASRCNSSRNHERPNPTSIC